MLTTLNILRAIKDEQVPDIVKYKKYKYGGNVSIMATFTFSRIIINKHILFYIPTTASINTYFT